MSKDSNLVLLAPNSVWRLIRDDIYQLIPILAIEFRKPFSPK